MRRPADVVTRFTYRGFVFEIVVGWNGEAQEWRWFLHSDLPRRQVGRFEDEVYSVINPIFKRLRQANMREAVMSAVEDGLHKLAGSKKRWGLVAWDGLWHER